MNQFVKHRTKYLRGNILTLCKSNQNCKRKQILMKSLTNFNKYITPFSFRDIFVTNKYIIFYLFQRKGKQTHLLGPGSLRRSGRMCMPWRFLRTFRTFSDRHTYIDVYSVYVQTVAPYFATRTQGG